MNNSKLIGLLAKFSAEEMGRLDEFVHSPYHNKHAGVTDLFQYLHSCYPYFRVDEVERHTIWQKVFPRQTFDYLKLRHTASNLLKVCEAFMQTEALKQKPMLAGVQLLEAYRSKGLPKHFDGAVRALENIREKTTITAETAYNHYQMLMTQELMAEDRQERRSKTGLQQVADKLDEAYMVAKLKQACALVSYENLYKQAYNYPLLEPVLQYISHTEFTNPLLLGYYHGLMTLRNPDATTHFEALKTLLLETAEHMPFDEVQELHIIARNFCIRRFNMGDAVYFKELFELYRLGLEDKVLLNENGHISPSAFKNIVAVSAPLEAYDWAENFVRQGHTYLEERYQNDYINYNLARLYFARKNYGPALQLLNQVDYHDVFVAADARTLLLKTYFELSEYDALDALLDSFKQFVTRRKELAYHRENYLNTIKFTRYLLNFNPRDQKRREILHQKIAASSMMTERVWLLEKLAESKL